jgi:C-terminal processing protease CtpA/Prc
MSFINNKLLLIILSVLFVSFASVGCSSNQGNEGQANETKLIVESFIQEYNNGGGDAAIARISSDITVSDKSAPDITTQDARTVENLLKSNAEFNRNWKILEYLDSKPNSLTLSIESTGDDIKLTGMDSVVSEITFEVTDGKISKMITSIDQATIDQLSRNTAGGIGIATELQSDRVLIISVALNSPAEKAGLKSGFEIMAIDGVKCAEMKQGEQLVRIRGQIGTDVILTIRNPEEEKTYDLTLTRVDISKLSNK